MALVNCPECGKEVSDTAKSCPECGYRMKKAGKPPKKILIAVGAVLAVLVVIFILCTIMYGNNPFKRIKDNTSKLGLILSYGIPDGDMEWDNVSFGGLKGTLTVEKIEGRNQITWFYAFDKVTEDIYKRYGDNIDKIYEGIEEVIPDEDKNPFSNEWCSEEENKKIVFILNPDGMKIYTDTID